MAQGSKEDAIKVQGTFEVGREQIAGIRQLRQKN